MATTHCDQVSESDNLEVYGDGDEVHFKRTISATGVGAYKIDDKDVTAEVGLIGVVVVVVVVVAVAVVV